MVANLIKFLLLKYPAKELTSQVKMLKKALRDNQEHFPAVFSQASQCLQLVCGVEVKKVEPREHIYIMVPTMGLTYDVMLNSGQGLPRASLLVLVLSLIMWNADHAPEEKVWGALSRMDLSQLQLSERQASLPAEHLDKRQPHNNCSACRWHNDSKEKEVSVDDQTLSSIPSQRVHPRG
uniref:MAGE domain-containing protein n=1 Tax=Bos mutus grunniens TaxID=30521 RepID=A0A8B9YX95_BOSMU